MTVDDLVAKARATCMNAVAVNITPCLVDREDSSLDLPCRRRSLGGGQIRLVEAVRLSGWDPLVGASELQSSTDPLPTSGSSENSGRR